MTGKDWIIPTDRLLEVDKCRFLEKIHSKPYFLRRLISLEKEFLMAQKSPLQKSIAF